jgi:hypothetical protein
MERFLNSASDENFRNLAASDENGHHSEPELVPRKLSGGGYG